jgi:hypothetical protein
MVPFTRHPRGRARPDPEAARGPSRHGTRVATKPPVIPGGARPIPPPVIPEGAALGGGYPGSATGTTPAARSRVCTAPLRAAGAHGMTGVWGMWRAGINGYARHGRRTSRKIPARGAPRLGRDDGCGRVRARSAVDRPSRQPPSPEAARDPSHPSGPRHRSPSVIPEAAAVRGGYPGSAARTGAQPQIPALGTCPCLRPG